MSFQNDALRLLGGQTHSLHWLGALLATHGLVKSGREVCSVAVPGCWALGDVVQLHADTKLRLLR